jgi:FixJ family two-component response regulator
VNRRSVTRRAHPITHRECLVLDRIGRDRTHKGIAAELGVSINTVANLAAKTYRKLGAQGMDRLHADAHSDRRQHP